MRNTMSKKIIAIVLLAATFGTTTVSAAENITKKETVYVNLDNSGSVEKTTVSDWIHSSKDDKLKIKDYSELDNIVNIKSNEKPIINGNNLRWNICVEAEEMVTSRKDNIVFFVMSPLNFSE